MQTNLDSLREVFLESLNVFLQNEAGEVIAGVNERNNCGRLAIYMQSAADSRGLRGYFADPEYNRMQEGKIKTILDHEMNVVTINCDLILHSRGKHAEKDNLLAIEMKKFDAPEREKQKDKQRLRALTKASYDDTWSADGKTFPEHVCGYVLGVYIELDRIRRECALEFYREGEKFDGALLTF